MAITHRIEASDDKHSCCSDHDDKIDSFKDQCKGLCHDNFQLEGRILGVKKVLL